MLLPYIPLQRLHMHCCGRLKHCCSLLRLGGNSKRLPVPVHCSTIARTHLAARGLVGCSDHRGRAGLACVHAHAAAPAAAPAAPELSVKPEILLSGCELDAAPLNVAMLLSGGVDSSLALTLVKAAGHNVTAFYLQIWFQEDFRNTWNACPWEEDISFCREVCRALDVPLQVVPLTDEYWEQVVTYSIHEIKAGRTPNPDVLCNSRVKFGAFYDHLTRLPQKFDRIASGHYAGLQRPPREAPPGTPVQLVCTPDVVKDQTYFLAHLSQEQLARAMFPLGALTKADVRRLAEEAGLPNKDRKDSQGICFLGKVKFGEFVAEHLGEKAGNIVRHEDGEVLGQHRGVWYHTIGQRRGVPLSGGPWYVTKKDIEKNIVYVSNQYYEHDKKRDVFHCGEFTWAAGDMPEWWREWLATHQGGEEGAHPQGIVVKVRHGPNTHTITSLTFTQQADDGTWHPLPALPAPGASWQGVRATVQLGKDDQGLAPGQFAVFYHEGVCLGSAVIQ